jgi:tRNA modification GTPase
LVEATLDFPEEEIDFLEKAGARAQLDGLENSVTQALARARQGALLRDGLRVVLAGQPNVGKSSLMNALAGAELSIVTPIAGTTRDRVAQTIQIEGVPLHITDTAGLRHDVHAADEVERIGIGRSWQSIQSADAVVFLHDLTRQHEALYAQAEDRITEQLPPGVPVLHVFNKADLVAAPAGAPGVASETLNGIPLSAHTGQGLEALRQALLQQAGWQAAPEGLLIARARHVQALRQCQQHLALAQQHAAVRDAALDLMAEELRLAHQALAQITGEFSSEDLLGEIFSKFCIGK